MSDITLYSGFTDDVNSRGICEQEVCKSRQLPMKLVMVYMYKRPSPKVHNQMQKAGNLNYLCYVLYIFMLSVDSTEDWGYVVFMSSSVMPMNQCLYNVHVNLLLIPTYVHVQSPKAWAVPITRQSQFSYLVILFVTLSTTSWLLLTLNTNNNNTFQNCSSSHSTN